MSTQTSPFTPLEPVEPFVDPDAAAKYLRTTRRHVLAMVREGLIPGHPLDPNAKKKDWRFLLSELHAYMVSCELRPPGLRFPCTPYWLVSCSHAEKERIIPETTTTCSQA